MKFFKKCSRNPLEEEKKIKDKLKTNQKLEKTE
jgi:hypothetical protein